MRVHTVYLVKSWGGARHICIRLDPDGVRQAGTALSYQKGRQVSSKWPMMRLHYKVTCSRVAKACDKGRERGVWGPKLRDKWGGGRAKHCREVTTRLVTCAHSEGCVAYKGHAASY